MPQILVTRNDGQIFWNETVTAADFETDHFRRCLVDRLGWAVADAEAFTLPPAVTIRDMSVAVHDEAAAA